jgi:hypothetical protein
MDNGKVRFRFDEAAFAAYRTRRQAALALDAPLSPRTVGKPNGDASGRYPCLLSPSAGPACATSKRLKLLETRTCLRAPFRYQRPRRRHRQWSSNRLRSSSVIHSSVTDPRAVPQ